MWRIETVSERGTVTGGVWVEECAGSIGKLGKSGSVELDKLETRNQINLNRQAVERLGIECEDF